MANDETPPEFLYVQVKERLAAQLEELRALDTKAGTLAGLAAVFGGIIFAGPFLLRAHLWLRIPVVLLVAASVAMALWCFLAHAYYTAPEPLHLYERYHGLPYEDTLLALISVCIAAFEINQPGVLRKARAFIWAVGLLFAAVLLAAQTYLLHGRADVI